MGVECAKHFSGVELDSEGCRATINYSFYCLGSLSCNLISNLVTIPLPKPILNIFRLLWDWKITSVERGDSLRYGSAQTEDKFQINSLENGRGMLEEFQQQIY